MITVIFYEAYTLSAIVKARLDLRVSTTSAQTESQETLDRFSLNLTQPFWKSITAPVQINL